LNSKAIGGWAILLNPLGSVGSRSCRCIIQILGCLFLLASANGHMAHAFVPQGPQILDMLVSKIGKAGKMRAQQDVHVQDQTLPNRSIALKETVSYIFPDRFRSDAWYQETNRVHVADRNEAVTIVDGAIVSYQNNRYDRYKDLLLFRNRNLLHKTLLAQGLDVGITSLGRFDDRIVYVIGARYPEESESQVWVDKERLLPLRLIFMDQTASQPEGTERIEFVYRNWRKFGDGFWYPMRIETYANQQLNRVIEVRDVQVDAAFSPELLNVSYLRSVYKTVNPVEPSQQSGTDAAGADDVQRTIDQFKKKFEQDNE
jgi:outer membrane lipoprotein-sorting protein